jgi:hypothetical protein
MSILKRRLAAFLPPVEPGKSGGTPLLLSSKVAYAQARGLCYGEQLFDFDLHQTVHDYGGVLQTVLGLGRE